MLTRIKHHLRILTAVTQTLPQVLCELPQHEALLVRYILVGPLYLAAHRENAYAALQEWLLLASQFKRLTVSELTLLALHFKGLTVSELIIQLCHCLTRVLS